MASRTALFVGNSVYDDAMLSRLRTPEADVRSLAAVLGDPDIGGFDEVETVVDGEEPRVRRAIARFFHNRRRDDLVLLYFSGHGVKDDHGRLFLAMRDTAYDQLKATAIPASFITECMDECRSKRQVLILDCCNSGAFARGTKGDRSAMTRETFEGLGYGRVVLTAADSTQYALEGDRVLQQAELSLFTHYLLEGLTTGAAARLGEPVITLDDWYEYAYEQVVTRMPNQTPRKWVYNQQGVLTIARARATATTGGEVAGTAGETTIAAQTPPTTAPPAFPTGVLQTPPTEAGPAAQRDREPVAPEPDAAPRPATQSEPRASRRSIRWVGWSAACGLLAASTFVALNVWRYGTDDSWLVDGVAMALVYISMFVGLELAVRTRERRAAADAEPAASPSPAGGARAAKGWLARVDPLVLGAVAGWAVGRLASWALRELWWVLT